MREGFEMCVQKTAKGLEVSARVFLTLDENGKIFKTDICLSSSNNTMILTKNTLQSK